MSRVRETSPLDDAAIRWLARLNSPELSAEDLQAFERWLDASPAHQLAYVKAEQFWERGAVLSRAPFKNVAQKTGKQRVGIGWLTWSAGGLASAGIAAGIFFFLPGPEPVHYQFNTQFGEISEQLLEDGSRVVLNANSQIRVELTSGQRLVFLDQGEVFFDVQTNTDRPFDVITAHGMVRVLGTEFSVSVKDQSLVTVVEGKVGLDADANDEFAPLTTLTQNQQLSLTAAKQGAAPQTVDAEKNLAWRDKKLIYKGEKLGVVLDDLQKFYMQKIIVADPAIADLTVVVVLRISDFKVTMNTLARSLNLTVDFSESGSDATLHFGNSEAP